MKIGLVGLPGSGKSTVFGALTGLAVATGFGSQRANVGVVKVPDPRVDALAEIYRPRKTVYAEMSFTDLGGGRGKSLDRQALVAMRNVDALCQVLRGFPDASGEPARPLAELRELETECLLADLEVAENRLERLRKEGSRTRERDLLERLHGALEAERPLRSLPLTEEELRSVAGFSFLTVKPLLLVLNVAEADSGAPPPEELEAAAKARGLGLVPLSAVVEMDIAQMATEEQQEFLESLGLAEPARNRFIRAAFALIDLVSMLTVGPDECRAWPVARGTPAPKAAAKIHSDIERGFIRAEVVPWQELLERGSEAKCKEAGVLRVEGKDYVIEDGDVVNFRFNV